WASTPRLTVRIHGFRPAMLRVRASPVFAEAREDVVERSTEKSPRLGVPPVGPLLVGGGRARGSHDADGGKREDGHEGAEAPKVITHGDPFESYGVRGHIM